MINFRLQFSQGTISSSLPPPSMRNSNQGSLLLTEQEDVSIDINASTPLLSPDQRRQQQQMVLYDESDNYVQQRAEAMQNIESTIVELGGIYQQLAHIVKEQGEMVERIDSNVMDAEMNIDAAHSEILKYFQTVTKNRWLMMKIFGVLIFFFIFFIIFMAWITSWPAITVVMYLYKVYTHSSWCYAPIGCSGNEQTTLWPK